ncbi:hypothetical protein BDR04DRAFT_1158149 [Suillus decipiens]|nr:hypothetical protein BDR04DRAFT_1158149 [Suillus decipiens]
MEYSSDDIAGARSLQFTTYIYVSIATVWAYDYACSLHEEWTFLLRSEWSGVKCLYIVTRYLPFILLATNIYQYFAPNVTLVEFQRLDYIITGLGVISVNCSECTSRAPIKCDIRALEQQQNLARGHAVRIFRESQIQSSPKLAIDAGSLNMYALPLLTSIPLAFNTSTVVTSAIPGITGSYLSSSDIMLFVPYLLLSLLELGLMILTLIAAIQTWRMSSSCLQVVLVRHNIFYYMCGFLFSVTNVFMSLFLRYSYTGTLYAFQFIILAILATRMHLHLWLTSRRADRYDTFVHIPMSDMSSADYIA